MKNIIFLLLLLHKFTFASFDMNENMQSTYSYIIELDFNSAKNNIAMEQINNPENGLIQLYQNYIDFLIVMIGEDLPFFENIENKKSERLSKLRDNDKESPYYLYSQAELHLQWAFARLKFEDYIPAAYEFIKAYYLLEKNKELFPNFILNNKCLGVLHSLLSAVPSKYHWILNVAGLEGNVDLGFSELNMILDDPGYKMYENEVLFLVSLLQINLKNNNSMCQQYLDRIGDRYKTNYLLNFAAARLSHNIGNNDYCLEVLDNRPSSVGKHPFYFLDYLQGMSYLYKLDYKRSKQYFLKYIKYFEGLNYIKSSYHKLAWIAELQNEPEQKNKYFDKTILEGNEYIDSDKVALKDAKKNYISHPTLLRSRLLYDGGYYLEALTELKQDIFDNNPEYFYRMARIKYKLGFENADVMSAYKRSVELSKGSTTNYYGPMSILQIGLIYEQANDLKNAKESFYECLSISNFDYERGIHQKAKAGINRIKN